MILRDLRSIMFASGGLLNGGGRFLDYPADGFRKKLFGAKSRRRNATLPKSPADPRKRPAQYPHRNGVCLMVDCANLRTLEPSYRDQIQERNAGPRTCHVLSASVNSLRLQLRITEARDFDLLQSRRIEPTMRGSGDGML